jgi:hypothetical protein
MNAVEEGIVGYKGPYKEKEFEIQPRPVPDKGHKSLDADGLQILKSVRILFSETENGMMQKERENDLPCARGSSPPFHGFGLVLASVHPSL